MKTNMSRIFDALVSSSQVAVAGGTRHLSRLVSGLNRQNNTLIPLLGVWRDAARAKSGIRVIDDAETSATNTSEEGRGASKSSDGQRGPSPGPSRRAALSLAATSAVGAAAPEARSSNETSALGTLMSHIDVEIPRAPAHQPTMTPANPLGIAVMHNPDANRGLATDPMTRRRTRTEGLIPPGVSTPEVEVQRALESVRRASSPLDKYRAAMSLYSSDYDAFLMLLRDHSREILPWVYTPTVGEACLNWGALVPRPEGLYLPTGARGRISELVANWPQDDVKIAVITDGGRILGLGDLGANGMGISIGKGILYSACAGIHPSQVLPVAIDVGTDTEGLLQDPLYVGQRTERLRGPAYFSFLDEVMGALRARYGKTLLVHFEDFSSSVAWDVLSRYRRGGMTVFNDDIEGTAAAVCASVMGALRVDGVPMLSHQRVLFYGAGQANLGAARLLVRAMQDGGMSYDEAKRRIWLMDSKGLIHEGRTGLNSQKAEFAHPLDALPQDAPSNTSDIASCVSSVQPAVLVGAAAQRNAFDRRVVEAHSDAVSAAYGPSARPVILALSNPTSKAECTAEEALTWSRGRAVFASGTAFPPVALPGGGEYVPAQSNNALVFPGLGLGAIASGATEITPTMFLAAARSVADQLTEEELSRGLILPSVDRINEVAIGVATAVAVAARVDRVASFSGSSVLECLSSDDETRETSDCVLPLVYKPYSRMAVGA